MRGQHLRSLAGAGSLKGALRALLVALAATTV